MDVHKSRERVFSILNDNDCASFTIKRNEGSAWQLAPKVRPSISPIQERPQVSRQAPFSKRNSSFSSVSSPPLLRYDSSSSKSSSGSMDSSPSPLTPAYGYTDGTLSYDNLLRQEMGFLPSPTTITPFMEQQMMLNATVADPYQQYSTKSMPVLAPAQQHPVLPVQTAEAQNVAPPSLTSDTSAATSISNSIAQKPSPPNSNTSNPNQKKNKYPCPYAASHNCFASFTTSGHAARHGKKHTGEKGVHCPVCNKAFTRKDNMKQHERTHKGSLSGSNSDDSVARRSKAAITKDAQKSKSKKADSETIDHIRSSSVMSPLSEVTSLAPTALDTPLTMQAEPLLYQHPNGVVHQMLLPAEPLPQGSLYPPLGDETMLNGNIMAGQPLPPLDKQDVMTMSLSLPPVMPGLIRGFSDLDTLAQAAESFDPYYGNVNGQM